MPTPLQVRCRHCGTNLERRGELRVGGRGLLSFHARCDDSYAAVQPWYRKPGWPLNRWRSFLPFNTLLLALAVSVHVLVGPVPPQRWAGVAGLLALANGWLLLARWVSYHTLERHLPRDAPVASTRGDT